MPDDCLVLAGDCTTISRGTADREQRGDVCVLVKPDNTVLVHDADGYQPVAWLTRPETVSIDGDTITATDGADLLRVVAHETFGRGRYPTSAAGVPVGDCPDDAGTLIRAAGVVHCTECDRDHSIPSDATVTGHRCGDCNAPVMRVERGRAFEVCIDRACDALDAQVEAFFADEWDCPDCEGAIHVIRRPGFMLGCDRYPDCDVGYSLPSGVVVGTCDCGLPIFETATGRRCLDSTCRHDAADAVAGP